MNNIFKTAAVIFIMSLISSSIFSQNPAGFDKMAREMADKTVPLITYKQVNKLIKEKKVIVYLDAREIKEFKVSHIKNAKRVGYNNFDLKSINGISKNTIIVVYCSVGYRSGVIGKKLRENGFTSVFNLYGGLFAWANNGNPIVSESKNVKKVHPYNSKWGKWLKTELHSK